MTRLMLLFLAALLLPSNTAVAMSNMELLFGCTSKVQCTIKDNLGGIPVMFERAAKEARANRTAITIVGRCPSACVIFASLVRKQVCLGPEAQMGLHRGRERTVYEPFGKIASELDTGAYFDPPPGYRVERTYFTPDYGDDITTWAWEENKMPYNGLYIMTRQEALRFWKECR